MNLVKRFVVVLGLVIGVLLLTVGAGLTLLILATALTPSSFGHMWVVLLVSVPILLIGLLAVWVSWRSLKANSLRGRSS